MNGRRARFSALQFLCWAYCFLLAQACSAQQPPAITYLDAQFEWQPPPPQAPAREGFVDTGGARLWYWDTGGDGEAVVFSHPASGSAQSWKYQQPFFAQLGYRLIAYSRRGHNPSEITDASSTGSATDDLLRLLDELGVDRFHLVALAAGADLAPDFAVSYPDRLLSLMIGCTIGRPGDPLYAASNATLLPAEFSAMPAWLKELGSFYRGANPDGVAAWRDISDRARVASVPMQLKNAMTPELLASIQVPTLLFTGDSDLYMPPARLRAYARYWKHPELVVLRGAGHAPYWEQPLAFNQMLLQFMRRANQQAAREQRVRWLPAQTEWTAPPPQASLIEAHVLVNGVRLWYQDSGGDGDAVILLHPLTGSAAIWSYQQPQLVAAGFRVIAYSRRGHYGSDSGPPENTGSAVDDLWAFAEQLGLKKFHLVGSAGGGFVAADYAVSHPGQLLSITIANSTAAVSDPEFVELYAAMLRTPEIIALPTWIKELGPSYRAANPAGVAAWQALEKIATPAGRVVQHIENEMNWHALAGISVPTLLLTSDADSYMPPPRLLQLAEHMSAASVEVAIFSEAGHSAYWEQPVAFNAVLIDFLTRHREAAR